MSRLLITSAKYRTHRGLSERSVPSRFLAELGDGTHLRVSDQSDAFGGDLEDWASGAGASTAAPTAAAVKFPVGSMVRHPRFGVGKVLTITTGANARAQVQFRDVGTKTLVLEFARLERV
jgi:DNA helicase-2/ATP-dependent DNA helicase PcrA